MGPCRTDTRRIQCGALLIAAGLSLGLGLASAATADSLDRASRYIEKGKYEAAVPHLRRGARKGDVRCEFLLGMWSLSGTAMEQDIAAAVDWIQKAAKQGLPIAQAYYGLLHANGLGVEQSQETAAKWLRKAAVAGEPMGQAALGVAAFLGDGVPEDRMEAYVWTSLAAEQGNERAAEYLPLIERELTEQQLADARGRVQEFVPRSASGVVHWKPDVKFLDPHTYLRQSTSAGR